jgi:hypothetical protein
VEVFQRLLDADGALKTKYQKVALRFDVKQPNVKNHRKCQIHESSSPRKGLVPTVAKFFCRKKLKNEKLVRWILNPAMHAENMVNYRF